MSGTPSRKPLEEFREALYAGDVEGVRALLDGHEEVRAAVNEPIGHFDARPAEIAKKNLPLLDLLLAHGADLNLKSAWWAGGFGLLEHGITPEEAAPLIARGAEVDVFAAAHLGLLDRLRELVEADPSLVQARGGDGKTALHCAATVEIADYLLDQGAEIDARDVDHESTPAQHLVGEAPEVARRLVERGAWFDLFLAVGLRDPERVERALAAGPAELSHRIGHGLYAVAHDNRRAATREEIGERRGDIYRWVFEAGASPLDVASRLGSPEIVEVLSRHASLEDRLLAACGAADRAAAEAMAAEHPGLVAGLPRAYHRFLPHKARANDYAAVELMLDLGFDPAATGPDGGDALHWAAFLGNAEMVRLLLRQGAPVNVRDASYSSTALGWCVFGSTRGWARETGDFATTARFLLEAGERPDEGSLPAGRADLDAVLGAAPPPEA